MAHRINRRKVCQDIQTILIAKGVLNVSVSQVADVMDAWLAGRRGVNLPHGLIGIATAEIIQELDREAPGRLARLPTG